MDNLVTPELAVPNQQRGESQRSVQVGLDRTGWAGGEDTPGSLEDGKSPSGLTVSGKKIFDLGDYGCIGRRDLVAGQKGAKVALYLDSPSYFRQIELPDEDSVVGRTGICISRRRRAQIS